MADALPRKPEGATWTKSASPSGTGSTPGWWCVVPRSHGICNTLNDAEDESCDACGNDRARSTEVEEAGPDLTNSLRVAGEKARRILGLEAGEDNG